MIDQFKKRALFVVGMHRSGTSALARILSLAGAGLPRTLMPIGPHNPTGHWEPAPIAAFNDRLLHALGTSWSTPFALAREASGALPLASYAAEADALIDEQFGERPLIVFKEPRATILADFWCASLRRRGFNPSVILMSRAPDEVAASLTARDGFVHNHGLLLWTAYTTQAEQTTRGERRAICTYDELLADPVRLLSRLEGVFDLPFPSLPAAREGISSFVRKDLRHQKVGAAQPRRDPAFAPVYRLADWMEARARDEGGGDSPDDAAAWLQGLAAIFAPMWQAQEAAAIAYRHRLRAWQQAGGSTYDDLIALRSALAQVADGANRIEERLRAAYHPEPSIEPSDPERPFDPARYLFLNPDLAAAGTDPHEHYRLFGKQEGRLY